MMKMTILGLASLWLLSGLAWGELREFTNESGQKIKAELLSYQGTEVTLRRADGQQFTLKAAQFSLDDQIYIKEWMAKTPEARKRPLGLPPNALFYKGKWYAAILEEVTWKRAQEKCRSRGGQLACIPDEEAQEFLGKLSKGLELWIGATDEKVEGLWVWSDGTEMKYKAWGPAQPKGGREENYAAMGSYLNRGWFDAQNDWPCVGYMCEWTDR